jgi:hypothetical protein
VLTQWPSERQVKMPSPNPGGSMGQRYGNVNLQQAINFDIE